MKKTLIFLSLWCIMMAPLSAQIYYPENGKDCSYYSGCTDDLISVPMDNEHNCIVDITYRNCDGSGTSTKVRYYDGLGTLIEDVAVGASPTGDNLVVWHDSDGTGRSLKTWLPAVMAGSGKLFLPRTSVCQMSVEAYNMDTSPFEKLIYEDNPQGRLKECFRPGEDWQNKEKCVRTEYLTNVKDEQELNCFKILIAQNSNSVRVMGNYPTGSLQVLKMINEDGEVNLEFRDNLNHLILSRRLMQYGDPPLDTYYVYDGLNLRYIFPPNASQRLHSGTVSASILNNYTYSYRYDGRNRLVSKKTPGSNAVLMAYDLADRLVFSQNGEQQKKSKCTFHLYDIYGRECVMGECIKTLNSSENGINDYVRCDYTKTGPFMGYTLSGVDINEPQILSAKYYDCYDYLENDSLKYVNDETYGLLHRHPRGFLTGSISARLGDSITYDTSAFYYDEYGRMIQSHKTNHLGGYEHEFFEYSFSGEVLRHKLIHSKRGSQQIVQFYQYTYDHEGRLLKKAYSLNDGAPVMLADNEYDKLGRLICNKVTGNPNLKTTYGYNVRSWITSVKSGPFSEIINYNQPSSHATPRYGGDISEITEKHFDRDSTFVDKFSFFYDGCAQLLSSQHENDPTGDVYSTSYEYDQNGNITHISRKGQDETGTAAIMDDLVLTYTGDRLTKATNAAPVSNTYNSMHFGDASDEKSEYSYDANGNLTKDSNKNILSIQYNILNLPQKLIFANGAFEKMTYSINGEKLRVRKKTIPQNVHPGTGELFPDPLPSPAHTSMPMGTTLNIPLHTSLAAPKASVSLYPVTDYCGSIIYKDGSLLRIMIDGGYITFKEDGTPIYHFYLTDHLGSNRMVVSATGTIEQQNLFYPFGASRSDSKNSGQTQPYKYNGKELDYYEDLAWYDYGARMYDPVLGRFMTQDPLAENEPGISPYVYCRNNPIRYVDPNGKEPTEEEAARIAAHVYGDQNDDILVGNWRVSSREFGISNKYGLKSQVYEKVDKAGKVLEYVYATAGTEKRDIKDWVADITQVVGASRQYHVSAANAQKVSSELNKEGIELNYVGHSLGGGEAALNSLLTYGEGKGRRALTFNAAGVSLATKIKEGGLSIPFKSERSIKAYITLTDPLNIIQNGNKLLPSVNGKRAYVLPKRINGHDIENFY